MAADALSPTAELDPADHAAAGYAAWQVQGGAWSSPPTSAMRLEAARDTLAEAITRAGRDGVSMTRAEREDAADALASGEDGGASEIEMAAAALTEVAWRLDSRVAQSRAAISPSTCARATSVSTSRQTAQGRSRPRGRRRARPTRAGPGRQDDPDLAPERGVGHALKAGA